MNNIKLSYDENNNNLSMKICQNNEIKNISNWKIFLKK